MTEELRKYISSRYLRWLDYACFHAKIHDQAEDILGEVILSLLEKDQDFILGMLDRKELDFYVLRMIKLNAHSRTSPYQQKMKDVLVDDNTPPEILEDDHYIPMSGHYNQETGDGKTYMLIGTRLLRLAVSRTKLEAQEKALFEKFYFGDLNILGQAKSSGGRYSQYRATFHQGKQKVVSTLQEFRHRYIINHLKLINYEDLLN